MGNFTMPSLGADMDEGTLLEWRVGVGDHVTKGEIIAVVDTEKSTVEVEVFETGVIEELLVEPGTEVAVGTPLARIGADAGSRPHDDPETATPAATPAARPAPVVSPSEHDAVVLSPLVRHLAEERHVDLQRLEGTGLGHRVTRADVEHATNADGPGASPLARRRALELGVDLDAIHGSGPGGAVRARDVVPGEIAHGEVASGDVALPDVARPAAGARTGDERRASVRQAISRLMSTSNREIPHYHVSSTIDLAVAVDWLERENAGHPVSQRLLSAALLVKATALAAARHPELNGWWIEETFKPSDGVHLAVAVALRGGGLITPVIHEADQRTLRETMDAVRDLVTRARQGSLRSSDLADASITVTNLGDRGAESVLGVIQPPQVALVGFGRIVDRPVAVDGLVGVHPTVVTTLSGDHRATDGMIGSRFIETIDELLQQPGAL